MYGVAVCGPQPRLVVAGDALRPLVDAKHTGLHRLRADEPDALPSLPVSGDILMLAVGPLGDQMNSDAPTHTRVGAVALSTVRPLADHHG